MLNPIDIGFNNIDFLTKFEIKNMQYRSNYKYFILFFILGISASVTINSIIETNDSIPKNDSLTTQSSIHGDKLPSVENKINNLESQINTNSHSLENINVKIDRILTTLKEFEPTSSESSMKNKSINSDADHNLSDDRIYAIKNDLYAKMFDTDAILPDILESNEFAQLPQHEQQEVLSELAQKLDSGEINKASFLPGYRSN